MPTSVAITAIDTGTDICTTGAPHGLTTGDRFRLRNVGGELPAATPALAAVTDYFAIVTGSSALKIATSSSNAQAGTAVNLTGSGSGVNLIEYGLPYCVPRIAAADTQVFSADDNATWNALVALHARLTGQAQTTWPADFAHGEETLLLSGADAVATNANISRANLEEIVTTGSTALGWSFPLKVGDRPKVVRFDCHGDGAVDITSILLRIYHQNGTTTTLVSTSSTNVPALPTLTTETLTVASPVALGATDRVLLTLNVSAANLTVPSVRMTFDRPPLA